MFSKSLLGAFKKSLLPVVDVSVVTLLFGICFLYIAPIALNSFGLALVIGSLMTFICVYLLNGLLHILFFNNQIMVNRFGFFGKPSNEANEALSQSNMRIPSSLDATRLEFPYYNKMSNKKIDTTGKKALIAVIVIGVILVVAIILFNVLGFTSSSLFHTESCLAIKTSEDVIARGWINGLNYTSYQHDITNGWWYFYTNADNVVEVAKTVASKSGLVLEQSVLVQSIIGSTNQDILNFAIISIVVGIVVSSVYGAIRFNWIAFVPMLLGSFGIPMIVLGIASIAQIKFDQFVVMGFVLTVLVNTIFCAGILGNINQSWSRKDPYNNIEFKYIINAALTNAWQYIWVIAAAYILAGLYCLIALIRKELSLKGSIAFALL